MRNKHHSFWGKVTGVILVCLVYNRSFAQFTYYDEYNMFTIEFGIGAASYYGDLTEKATPLNQANLATSFGLSYSVTTQIRPMLSVSFLKLGADDKNNTRQNLVNRNLNFQSNVFDVSLGLRYHFLPPTISLLTPYIYGGIGVFHFNPYTIDRSGTKQFLQPLGTEGQRLANARVGPYNLTQLQVPFGAGLNLTLDNQLSVGLDITVRKLFTDYLDDVSTFYANKEALRQLDPVIPSVAFRGDELVTNAKYPSPIHPRGNPEKTDMYYTVGFKVMYQIFH